MHSKDQLSGHRYFLNLLNISHDSSLQSTPCHFARFIRANQFVYVLRTSRWSPSPLHSTDCLETTTMKSRQQIFSSHSWTHPLKKEVGLKRAGNHSWYFIKVLYGQLQVPLVWILGGRVLISLRYSKVSTRGSFVVSRPKC